MNVRNIIMDYIRSMDVIYIDLAIILCIIMIYILTFYKLNKIKNINNDNLYKIFLLEYENNYNLERINKLEKYNIINKKCISSYSNELQLYVKENIELKNKIRILSKL